MDGGVRVRQLALRERVLGGALSAPELHARRSRRHGRRLGRHADAAGGHRVAESESRNASGEYEQRPASVQVRQLLLPHGPREAHLRAPARQEGLAASAQPDNDRRLHAAADPQVQHVQRGPRAEEALHGDAGHARGPRAGAAAHAKVRGRVRDAACTRGHE